MTEVADQIPDENARSILKEIKDGEFKRILVLTGAGVSTNAGIPDYRSEGGIFHDLMKEFPQASTPETLLTRSFVDKYNVFEHKVFTDHIDTFKDAKPTASHILCKWLYDKGWLVRVYTQNIDGLHHKAGLPDDMIVEFHGSLLKKNVVLYGDPIPSDVLDKVVADFSRSSNVDLLLVLGTSLKVFPFAGLEARVPYGVTRILIDKDPNHDIGRKWRTSGSKFNFINMDIDECANIISSS